ncbi:prolyl oligopeptidase family serine peptidase [Loktanella sp. F6476L]|uniref:alpha/beta hydrolase family esterase n=1 Tax=Loktanella sp. F6476L TaxID=2926405 RepID=UPI001FF26B72|nr:PHB depolymerase family esterase [Loktanella sp. F6476L]MCK0120519.1 prolyl oligopeptidase family serine peptidase [Loktanella sp. F6476L]
MSQITKGAAALCLTLVGSTAQAGCGPDPDPCDVPLGTYHIALPDTANGPIPALMFLHGAGGSGTGSTRSGGMADNLNSRGYAVIGPNGLQRENTRFGPGWSFHPDRLQQRNEMAFLLQVAEDAASRFGVDRDAIILGGFSIGGSMTSYIACDDPTAFAAYAPVGGSFWRPHPVDCAGPVQLLHTHGWKDKTVPLEGRPLGNGTILQGDVWHAMGLWRAENGCDGLRADTFDTSGDFWVRTWEECDAGTALEFVLHPGGHGIPRGWSTYMLDWFEALSD